MNKVIQCDIAIIGGGAGGLSLAAGAAQLGAKVVLIESGKMGGDCLNYGCVPSKALLSAAKSFYHAKHCHYLDTPMMNAKLDFQKVMQHVNAVIAVIAEHDSVERFESLGVKVIQAPGQFIDSTTLQAGDYAIKAKRFVIATGSSPFVPPIAGLEVVPFETNETIFNLKHLPEHLIVIGGGPIGCELAEAFAMMGSQVTILEAFKILPKYDADCVEILRTQFESMNITMHEGMTIQEITKSPDGSITIHCEQSDKSIEIRGSHLLIATGRRANVAHLNLERANIAYSNKGIQVDGRLRSTNKKAYAIGDVAGSFQFTHIANYHAGIVLRNILFRLPAKVDYQAVPWVTYTEPEMAHVGMLAENVLDNQNVQITEWMFQDNDRAQTESKTRGKIKVISDKNGRILGATIIGEGAGELILPWVMAIREKKTLRSFTDLIAPYPTLSEISKRVAGQFYTPKLFSNGMRRLVRLLLKLG